MVILIDVRVPGPGMRAGSRRTHGDRLFNRSPPWIANHFADWKNAAGKIVTLRHPIEQ
jgi:hypothetical protein